MKDYEEYIVKPSGPDDVAMIPYWVFEMERTGARLLRRRLWWVIGGLAAALVGVIVWRF